MKEYNFSNIIRWIEITLFIMVILNFGTSIYAINRLTVNSVNSLSNRLYTDVDDVSGALSGIHTMMLSEVGYDRDLDTLLVATLDKKKKIDEVTITTRIKSMIRNWSRELSYSVNYVIYFPDSGKVINDYETLDEYMLWRNIQKKMLGKLDNLDFKSGWNIVELNGEYYFLDIISNNRRYMFAYISVEEIIKSLESEFYGEDYYIALANPEDQIYHRQNELALDKIKPSTELSGTVRTNFLKQMLVMKQTVANDIDLIMVIHNYNSVLKTFWFQLVLVLLMIVVVSIVLGILRFVNKTVLRPIQAFNENIETLKNEEVYDVATHYQINELGNASKLMSEMVGRIKGLKIDIYEKTLEQQKTHMDFLTLQIEPHFYLNCLNIIYNMAQMEQYKEIQRLSNCVSEYLRYIFKSRERFATVKDELEHINKYLEIQKIRYGNCFESHITMDDKILNMELPPLVLQTFVENSLKYTINWEDDIELTIKGTVNEEAVIIIEDTGEGFEPEILYKLQNNIDISEGDRRIGIMNAVSRMKLAFGNDASILFYNCEKGGAGVEIRFPDHGKDDADKTIP
ncbi:MAG: histidine kinase [Herbinix sp.]|jgi:sensor histidine kinase YesM|nr:histidine kinase [Herbinix sp.]